MRTSTWSFQAPTRSNMLKVKPKDVSALTLSAAVYDRKGDIRKAQEAYEKVLAQEPRFATAANNLAWLYSEHGGDKEKAGGDKKKAEGGKEKASSSGSAGTGSGSKDAGTSSSQSDSSKERSA